MLTNVWSMSQKMSSGAGEVAIQRSCHVETDRTSSQLQNHTCRAYDRSCCIPGTYKQAVEPILVFLVRGPAQTVRSWWLLAWLSLLRRQLDWSATGTARGERRDRHDQFEQRRWRHRLIAVT